MVLGSDFLASKVVGRGFYFYLILDVYSRKIVGFEVHETDSSDHAMELLRRTALSEDIHTLSNKPVLHGDNGPTIKATTVLAMMHWLGLKVSNSRPRVSDDNAFVEAYTRPSVLRLCRTHGTGPAGSWLGTTTSTGTVESAM